MSQMNPKILERKESREKLFKPFTFKADNAQQVPELIARYDLGPSFKMRDERGQSYWLKYENLRDVCFLGAGEFSQVKKMLDKSTNRYYAVKEISPDDLLSKEKKYMNDLDALTKIDNQCPFLIHYFGALYVKNALYLLTECMDSTIKGFYSEADRFSIRLPNFFLAYVAQSVLETIVFMKTIKLMHRDIKPDNILINKKGEIKLCDLGVCGYPVNSFCHSKVGCVRYMPPEKIDSNEGYTSKSDIWSMGISLIELKTGQHPYEHVTNIFELSTKIKKEDAPGIKSSDSNLVSFIDDCMTKNTDQRPTAQNLLCHTFLTENINLKNNDMMKAIVIVLFEKIEGN